jgi:hypothetical protein
LGKIHVRPCSGIVFIRGIGFKEGLSIVKYRSTRRTEALRSYEVRMMGKSKKVASKVLKKKQEQAPKIDEAGLVLAGETLPTSLPIIPIRPRPFFPGLHIPLEVDEENLSVVELAMESSTGTLGMVLVKNLQGGDNLENLHRVGVAAEMPSSGDTPSDTVRVLKFRRNA